MISEAKRQKKGKKGQKGVDEAALAACLAYVDLNPIRAGIAETPETSRFTSVYERIQALIHKRPDGDAQFMDKPVDEAATGGSGELCAPIENLNPGSQADWLSRSSSARSRPKLPCQAPVLRAKAACR